MRGGGQPFLYVKKFDVTLLIILTVLIIFYLIIFVVPGTISTYVYCNIHKLFTKK